MSNLNSQQTVWVITRLVGLIRRQCVCHIFTDDKKCSRCRSLEDGKTAFPDEFQSAAEAAAFMGPKP